MAGCNRVLKAWKKCIKATMGGSALHNGISGVTQRTDIIGSPGHMSEVHRSEALKEVRT